jgi:hypothetical protein
LYRITFSFFEETRRAGALTGNLVNQIFSLANLSTVFFSILLMLGKVKKKPKRREAIAGSFVNKTS